MREWFDNESFWVTMYPFLFHEKRYARTPEEIDKVLTLTRIQGGSVLDLCCGPGRHSVELAKRGFTVTGVDRTKYLLNKAKQRAKKANVKVEFVLKDMRRFVRPNTFDLALSMFTSFGYFDKKKDDLRVLRNIHRSLKRGGKCIVDVMGKEQLAKVYQPVTSHRCPDGTIFIERHEILDDWTRIRNEWILIKGTRARTFKYHHTVYSGQELKDRMLQAGFRKVKLYGDLGGSEYGLNASRLVAVGFKG